MPISYYDRFADTRVGNAILRYTLGGIDKHPSLLQRAAINAAIGASYAADYGYMSYKRLRGNDYQPINLFGDMSAGAGGAAMQTEKARMASGYYARNPYAQRYRVPANMTRRTYKRTSKVLKANYRLKKNLPLSIGHEETTEVRSAPATKAVFTFMAERRLPVATTAIVGATVSHYTGDLYKNVNRNPANDELLTDADSKPIDSIWRYTATNVDARTSDTLTERSDWTMFTNAAWRDGYSMLNGRYATPVLAYRGYRTPFKVGGAVTLDTNWWQRAVPVQASADEPPIGASASGPYSILQCTDYHHLSEEVKVTVTNNSTQPTTVTLWECVLAHDLPMALTTNAGQAANAVSATSWGGLPCPLECWRASRRAYTAAPGGVAIYDSGAGIVPLADQPIVQPETPCVTATRVGSPLEVAKQGYDVAAYTAADAGPSGVQDIDHPATKVGGGILHHWYKVIPHSRVIAPGQTTTLSVHVIFNKRIPGTWWQTLYGVAGYTRAFFMTAKSAMVVGSTGVDEGGALALPNSRVMVNGPVDLTMKWTKRKRFTRVLPTPRRSIYYRAAIPEIDATALRNPEDNDVEGDEVGAEVGGN